MKKQTMTIERLTYLSESIELLHELSNASPEILIDALTGDVWSEEEAQEIKRFMGVCDE